MCENKKKPFLIEYLLPWKNPHLKKISVYIFTSFIILWNDNVNIWVGEKGSYDSEIHFQ